MAKVMNLREEIEKGLKVKKTFEESKAKVTNALTAEDVVALQAIRRHPVFERVKGDLDYHVFRGLLSTVTPDPISVNEARARKFDRLLKEKLLTPSLSISKTIVEKSVLAEAKERLSESGADPELHDGQDDHGHFGLDKKNDMDMPKGDADKGVEQSDKTHGDKGETADKGYMDEDTRTRRRMETVLRTLAKLREGDMPPPAAAPAAAAPPPPAGKPMPPKAPPSVPPKAESKGRRLKEEGGEVAKEQPSFKSGEGDSPLAKEKAENARLKSIYAKRVTEEFGTTPGEKFGNSVASNKENEADTKLKETARLKLENAKLRKKLGLREETAAETPDAKETPDYDTLEKVPGVEDISKGPAALEARRAAAKLKEGEDGKPFPGAAPPFGKKEDDGGEKEESVAVVRGGRLVIEKRPRSLREEESPLKPEDPGEGKIGPEDVAPNEPGTTSSVDTNNAKESRRSRGNLREEESPLKPEDPGEGSVGKTKVAPDEEGTIGDQGLSQNECAAIAYLRSAGLQEGSRAWKDGFIKYMRHVGK